MSVLLKDRKKNTFMWRLFLEGTRFSFVNTDSKPQTLSLISFYTTDTQRSLFLQTENDTLQTLLSASHFHFENLFIFAGDMYDLKHFSVRSFTVKQLVEFFYLHTRLSLLSQNVKVLRAFLDFLEHKSIATLLPNNNLVLTASFFF